MFGISVFLNDEDMVYNLDYIKRAHQTGFRGVFTSIHIPEENPDQYLNHLTKIGDLTQALGMELVVDISGNALASIGLSFTQIDAVKALGITTIRPDYGIGNEMIGQLSHEIKIALNASTVTEKDIQALEESQANFDQMEAWHNYYPRPETGLDPLFFAERNEFFKAKGMKVMGFIPGDFHLRGPIYSGLPSIEYHRGCSPFEAALELQQVYGIDKIFVGDPGLSDEVLGQFETYLKNQVIPLRALPVKDYPHLITSQHTQRLDAADLVIRSQEARSMVLEEVRPFNTVERPIGSITVDNHQYLRYMGELQITKIDLDADERVNVVGRVIEEDIALLEYILPGTSFMIDWVTEETDESR